MSKIISSQQEGGALGANQPTYLYSRWLFLRAVGLIFFSAFYSLAFQIRGLIGPNGILPAQEYFKVLDQAHLGMWRFWQAPSLLWLGSSDKALTILVAAGLICSVLLILNIWPKAAAAACTILFMSFVAAARDFSSYQSDGMLLEADVLSFFFAPKGFWPGLGEADPPDSFSRLLLLWECFRIYFESGVVKLASGDRQWRHLTAMDHYYENGPLPTWIGWYAQQYLPHSFHAATALATLLLENVLVWFMVLPRSFRLAFFWITVTFQTGIILTANYTFLNYLQFSLGLLLLDDKFFNRFCLRVPSPVPAALSLWERGRVRAKGLRPILSLCPLALKRLAQCWLLLVTIILFPLFPSILPQWALAPAAALEPFRIANTYGLFAVMTTDRYEIEFQGSQDGKSWTSYPFRYKPQDIKAPPGLYAPYQPRFDWNLWFASLGNWRGYSWVLRVEQRLLESEPAVLQLFAQDPFAGKPPRMVRAVIWQYWFTDAATKKKTGEWWRRQLLGLYAPELGRDNNGNIYALTGH